MADNKAIYDKNTLEFVTVALEFCVLMEAASGHTPHDFTDKAVKILPLLYLKAALLPETGEPEDGNDAGHFITENTYEAIRCRTAALLGEYDTFLDTFHPDMNYSDTPVASTISENLADVYQDLGDFAALFRRENEEVMEQALHACRENFRMYWGQKLLKALQALHAVRFGEEPLPDGDRLLTEKYAE
ncbi:MAG: DUF5063 domain-containing protein [Tannerella sp.]|jgi:hypothetical protein|nr:DUF5063 domain-containing protein [Tannerella sp.]